MVELTYKLSLDRLTRFQYAMQARSRRITLRTSRGRWTVYLLSMGLVTGMLMAMDPVTAAIASVFGSSNASMGYFGLLALLIVLSIVGRKWMERRERMRAEERYNYDEAISLKQHERGIHIGTDAIEYDLKWRGIEQMLLEPDGIVLGHGQMFWLIPDSAFPSPAARRTFVRDVYGRMSDEARAASAANIKLLLAEGSS